jgi:hypothetical protein
MMISSIGMVMTCLVLDDKRNSASFVFAKSNDESGFNNFVCTPKQNKKEQVLKDLF